MTNSRLNDQIKKFRASKKMTLAVLAERLSVTTSAVAAYENGTRNPSFDVLIKMARIFNVTVDNLLGCSNTDLVDVSYLTGKQREEILNIISTYQKFNFLLKEVFGSNEDKVTSDKLTSEVEWNINFDLDTFTEFVKKKNANKK